MSDLFTVIIDRKHLVSKFGTSGRDKNKLISKTETVIEQRIGDLPLMAARTYERDFPDNNVRIIPQNGVTSEPLKRQFSSKTADFERPKAAKPTIRSAPASADRTGTYGDVVNSMMKGA